MASMMWVESPELRAEIGILGRFPRPENGANASDTSLKREVKGKIWRCLMKFLHLALNPSNYTLFRSGL
jgi:hypothetical protein